MRDHPVDRLSQLAQDQLRRQPAHRVKNIAYPWPHLEPVLAQSVGNISQKMLIKTLREMEADGFVTRTVYAVVPPKVEYRLTKLGYSLGEAFCAVWIWAEKHRRN